VVWFSVEVKIHTRARLTALNSSRVSESNVLLTLVTLTLNGCQTTSNIAPRSGFASSCLGEYRPTGHAFTYDAVNGVATCWAMPGALSLRCRERWRMYSEI